MIRLGGFTYSFHSVRQNKSRWYCSTHRTKGCKAGLHTIDNLIVNMMNFHNHCAPNIRTELPACIPVVVKDELSMKKI
ncbi:hypothetical protein JYU34_004405 [Plutella xylostella]|uniref:FLYWCH-type domain-containing protein n=1 Tax=Plutella xylostella TaxID=51655 RepID=A0ABQ7QXY4_PLUXY|nr:hypothetical protein JYU34_004405 [Plutella xylostella]